MDDLHERMEHLSRRVDTAAVPDLERARERHTRRRRTSALVVGVALAAIVALLAVQMIRPAAPSVPVASDGPSSDTVTVWPDADTGDEPWRSSPERLIERFSYLVLGWSTPDIVEMDGAYELRPEPCPDAARCVPPLTVTTAEVSTGLWSVRSVSQPDLMIDVPVAAPATALTGGSRIRFDLGLADDRAAHVGMVASNGCREATAFEVGLDAGSHVLELPNVTTDDPACDDLGTGYVFAYAMDDTTVPTGDPLLEAAAIEYPWLTVIPIYLEMEESDGTSTSPPAETLTVSCGSVGTGVVPRAVAAGPMGVALEFEDANDGVTLRIDESMTVSERHVVLDLPPGRHEVYCSMGEAVTTPVPFEVVDAEGYWTDPSVDCAPPDSIEEATPVAGPTSWEDMLVWVALPENLPEGFPIVRARFVGYPESDPARIIGMFLDPDDQLIRRLNVIRLGPDEWTVETVTCPIK